MSVRTSLGPSRFHKKEGQCAYKVQNIYAPDNSLVMNDEEIRKETSPLLIMGDLNSIAEKRNSTLRKYLESMDSELIDIGVRVPTHLRGNRIDHVLTNYPFTEHKSWRALTLLSDHYGIRCDVLMPNKEETESEKPVSHRITIPKKREGNIRYALEKWFANYTNT